MVDENYDKILDRIVRAGDLSKEEIERKVEAKKARLSGLISREGAAQIVAAELGINFDKQQVKISEVLPGMRRVNLIGKIINLFPVRSFTRNNQEHKVLSMVVADDTSNIRVVLWDTNHINLFESGKIKEGDVVEISNANIRNMEVHLNSFSDIKYSNEKLENIKEEKIYREKPILEFKQGLNSATRAFIVQSFPPRFFEVCPECGKKLDTEKNCKEHGKQAPEKKALLNVVLDDGTENIRAVLFSNILDKLNLDLNNFKNEDILGKEMIFSGTVRKNKIFNNPEFVVNDIKEVNVEELIANLEK